MVEPESFSQGVMPSDSSEWDRLRVGLDDGAAWKPRTELQLTSIADGDVLIWAVLAGTGVVLLAWIWILHRRHRGAVAHWPALRARFAGMGEPADADVELRSLELLVGLKYPDTRKSTSAWQSLSPSEQVVAMGLLKHKTVHQLAQELACTPSHIYNLRTSIRKKWNLDREVSLQQAAEEFHRSMLGE